MSELIKYLESKLETYKISLEQLESSDFSLAHKMHPDKKQFHPLYQEGWKSSFRYEINDIEHKLSELKNKQREF